MPRCICALFCLLTFSSFAAEPARVAAWKDDKKAAFVLMFDDSMPSHVKNVFPELQKRGFVGTFYINPGSNHYKAHRGAWETDMPAAGMVLANHTFTHQGAKDVANLESEIVQCNDVINTIYAKNKPTLISFGRPGVKQGAWNVTDAQLKEQLAKHNLIYRPDVNGRFAQIHLKTAADMIGRIDKALASGGLDFVAFHGVGGEWLSIDMPAFIELLDALTAKREQLWITDAISAHKYETERKSAEVKVVESNATQFKLTLATAADTKIYDAPLTVVLSVPAAWKSAEVTQGKSKTAVSVANGSVRFDALPGTDSIVVKGQ